MTVRSLLPRLRVRPADVHVRAGRVSASLPTLELSQCRWSSRGVGRGVGEPTLAAAVDRVALAVAGEDRVGAEAGDQGVEPGPAVSRSAPTRRAACRCPRRRTPAGRAVLPGSCRSCRRPLPPKTRSTPVTSSPSPASPSSRVPWPTVTMTAVRALCVADGVLPAAAADDVRAVGAASPCRRGRRLGPPVMMSLPAVADELLEQLACERGDVGAVERVVVRASRPAARRRGGCCRGRSRRARDRAAVVGDAVLGDDHARGRRAVVRRCRRRRRRGSRCGWSSARPCRRGSTGRCPPRRRRRSRSRAARRRGRCRRRARRRRRPRRCGRRPRCRDGRQRRAAAAACAPKSRTRTPGTPSGLMWMLLASPAAARTVSVPSALSSTVEACAVAGRRTAAASAARNVEDMEIAWGGQWPAASRRRPSRDRPVAASRPTSSA